MDCVYQYKTITGRGYRAVSQEATWDELILVIYCWQGTRPQHPRVSDIQGD